MSQDGTPSSQDLAMGRGLAVKMFAATMPVLVLVVLLTQAGLGWINYHARLGALANRADLIATLTAQAIARPLWNLDRPIYQAQVEALTSDPGFLQARVLDETGQPVLALGSAPAADGTSLTVLKPVIEPGGTKTIGTFELTLSKAELEKDDRIQIGLGVGTVLVLLVTAFAILHNATRRLILGPLGRLLDAMARVERKDWTQVGWSSGDEIGRVVTAFNHMVDGLRSGDEAKRLLRELEIAQSRLIENNAALEAANRLVLDSIGYARKIQDGLLPDASTLGDSVREFHVSWNPLQQVGGDYYWLHRLGRRATLLLADCTGHGVPGAFMTVVVATALDRILVEGGEMLPSEILCRLDKAVRERLRQDRPDGSSDDGLDAAVCLWDGETQTLTFAGANLPLVTCRDGQIGVVKGNRHSLGYRTGATPQSFDDHVLPMEPGTAVYLFTDGMTDHVGGEPPRLYGRRRLLDLIQATSHLALHLQVDRIEQALAEHRGGQNRRDDMTIMAFRPY
ncbi:PP2C family protein-serine/threonine phosphatase [Paramagnetospirillum magneticum]|uniref:Serine phosphatase RsbU, regulator of sigma subunit n=1 Tax=Paramagnetospirillum magneticum (strain ATCC 700264 / AMB-1) TaxID=342108 RepID=Q2W1L8_PARM1|nr:SpoIIE family protein phosphatase [Paramagnetospirillum magneticum]BAE52257.1 Serine phosphatase RsbU, regulator of sigma subunit [Paramagnetospirillum magneticum AMB-1]